MPEEQEPEKTLNTVKPIIHPDKTSYSKGIQLISQKTSESEWVIDRRSLNGVLENIEKVFTDVRMVPYNDGSRTGFRVTEVKPDGVFSRIGLANGDIILKVNDYSVDSPEKAAQLFMGLKGESNISVDVMRGGRTKRLSYHIK